jgi:hypothetical protein
MIPTNVATTKLATSGGDIIINPPMSNALNASTTLVVSKLITSFFYLSGFPFFLIFDKKNNSLKPLFRFLSN